MPNSASATPVAAALNPWVLPGLAVMVEAIYAAALYMAFIGSDPALFNIMCGAAIAQAAIPLQWYFGSSKSSQDKDASAAASVIVKDATIAETTRALAVSERPAAVTTTTVEARDGTRTTKVEPAAPAQTVTTTTVDPGPPPTTTTTTTPATTEGPKP